MKLVSRFEYNLLKITQYFFGRVPTTYAITLLQKKMDLPNNLSEVATKLVKDHLSKGCVLYLAKSGGWIPDTYLRKTKMSEGRLWSRTEAKNLSISFSEHSLRFLMWITAFNPADTKSHWVVSSDDLTVGDWLLFFLVYKSIRTTELGKFFIDRCGFFDNVLIRLMYPQDFAVVKQQEVYNYKMWSQNVGSFVVECIQPELTESWIQTERSKAIIKDPAKMLQIGESQSFILEGFLKEIEKVERRDLVKFLYKVFAKILTPGVDSKFWNGSLDNKVGKLSDRTRITQASLALIRQAERLYRWEQEARSVGYFDEGYDASQLVKRDWEKWNGDSCLAQAQRVIKDLDPMKQAEGTAIAVVAGS